MSKPALRQKRYEQVIGPIFLYFGPFCAVLYEQPRPQMHSITREHWEETQQKQQSHFEDSLENNLEITVQNKPLSKLLVL